MSILSLIAVAFLPLQAGPAPKTPPARQEATHVTSIVEYRNTAEGITFKMENGRVELTVPSEKDRGRHEDFTTFKADSPDEFKRKYPELAKKYSRDQYLSGAPKGQESDKWWEDWSSRLGKDQDALFQKYFSNLPKDTPETLGQLDRWFEDEHRMLRDLERREHSEGMPALKEAPNAHPALFGVLVGPVSEPLRCQLGLQPHEGLIVLDVERNSIAEAAGVRKYDVLRKLSGTSIDDAVQLKDLLMTALQSREFNLEVIRAGSALNLHVHPAHS